MSSKQLLQKCKAALQIPLLALLAVCCSSYQDEKINESTSKALFIYNFTKHFEWPLGKPGDAFIIGLYGHCDLVNELLDVCYKKSVGAKQIEIKIIKSAEDALQCSMLYIPANYGKEVKTITGKLKKEGVLVISESQGSCKKGSSVNIVQKQNQLRFEINEKAIEDSGLKVSSQLLALAILVK